MTRRPPGTAAVLWIMMGLAGCAPTAAELLTAGRWSSAARAACFADVALREPAMGCSSSVQAMASEGARRKEVRTAAAACDLPNGAARRAFAGALGPLLDAAGELAAALAEQLREREAIRQAVLRQAIADLEAEQLCLPRRPLPASAP
jgi:hypothetical protein